MSVHAPSDKCSTCHGTLAQVVQCVTCTGHGMQKPCLVCGDCFGRYKECAAAVVVIANLTSIGLLSSSHLLRIPPCQPLTVVAGLETPIFQIAKPVVALSDSSHGAMSTKAHLSLCVHASGGGSCSLTRLDGPPKMAPALRNIVPTPNKKAGGALWTFD
jgi:hypothetical protein